MSIKKFNPKLNLKDYLDEGDYRRTQIRIVTENLNLITDKIASGWSFFVHKKGFLLIAPEKWIVDLSEPFKAAFFTSNANVNLAYFYFIKDQVDKKALKNKIYEILHNQSLEVFLSEGVALQTEVRIILNNKNLGEIISSLLFASFFEAPDYKNYINKANQFLGETRMLRVERCKKINEYPKKIRNLFLQIRDNYSLINISKRDIFSYDYVPGIDRQILNEFKDADAFIFIPWGCFKYLGSFLTEEIVDRTMFWEIHFTEYNLNNHKFRSLNLKGKKVVILDKSYTGVTIDKLANLVKKEGGFPIKVALFPKSNLAVQKADYIVFLDKLIKASEIDSSDPNWFFNLYKEVLR